SACGPGAAWARPCSTLSVKLPADDKGQVHDDTTKKGYHDRQHVVTREFTAPARRVIGLSPLLRFWLPNARFEHSRRHLPESCMLPLIECVGGGLAHDHLGRKRFQDPLGFTLPARRNPEPHV